MHVVLAEDLALLREGLHRALTDEGHTVHAVGDEAGLVAALTGDLDLAVVDVRLPPTFTDEGLRAAVAARQRTPGLPVLVLSQHVDQLYARELLATPDGGVGYLLKDRVMNTADFLDAVARVAAGGVALDPEVVSRIMTRNDRRGTLTALTPRERSVLELLAEGRSNSAIAATLYISDSAVTKHINNIFGKLDLHADTNTNRRVLVTLAYLNER